MNIYVYITALGMVLIGLYFVWRENKRESKEEQKSKSVISNNLKNKKREENKDIKKAIEAFHPGRLSNI